MAGAWTPGRTGLTLAERSVLTGAGSPVVRRPAPVSDVSAPPEARHCWVTGLPGLPGRCAGLLAEWRRDSGDGPWQGRVVYAVDDGDGVVLVEAWVHARHLQPAD